MYQSEVMTRIDGLDVSLSHLAWGTLAGVTVAKRPARTMHGQVAESEVVPPTGTGWQLQSNH